MSRGPAVANRVGGRNMRGGQRCALAAAAPAPAASQGLAQEPPTWGVLTSSGVPLRQYGAVPRVDSHRSGCRAHQAHSSLRGASRSEARRPLLAGGRCAARRPRGVRGLRGGPAAPAAAVPQRGTVRPAEPSRCRAHQPLATAWCGLPAPGARGGDHARLANSRAGRGTATPQVAHRGAAPPNSPHVLEGTGDRR